MSMYVSVDETYTEYDADGLDFSSHSLSVKVEHYRSFKYSLKWKKRMYSLRSSRLSDPSTKRVQKSPTSNERASRYKLRGQRGKEADDCVINEDNRKSCDTGYTTDEGQAVVIVRDGLDGLDEDTASECSSVASGPSVLHHASSRRLRSPQALCSACQKLYQWAKRTTTPIKSKLLDNDPKSLTCDQWVLIKKWAPRRLPDARPKLDEVVTLRRGKQPEETPACSRLHVFLQRDLRRARLQTIKKRNKSRRKRRRDGSQGCRVAKQQCLQSNSRQQRNTPTHMDDMSNRSFRSCRSSARYRNPKMDNKGNQESTVELSPSLVALETTKLAKPVEVRAKQKTQKKTDGFRDLLAQLRGNSSMIVKESR